MPLLFLILCLALTASAGLRAIGLRPRPYQAQEYPKQKPPIKILSTNP